MSGYAAQLAQLKGAFEQMKTAAIDTVITLDVIPRSSLIITANGQETTITDGSFADAMLSIWLGDHPVQEDLKQKLLGL